MGDEGERHKSVSSLSSRARSLISQKKESSPCWPHEEGIRRQIFKVFDSPESSQTAYVMSIIILLSILLAVLAFIIESLPQFRQPNPVPKAFIYIEIACVVIFTIEYFAKFFCCTAMDLDELGVTNTEPSKFPDVVRKLWAFLTNIMNIIDLLAILPFYIGLAPSAQSSGLQVVRILRIARVFRVFKLGKHSQGVQLFVRVLKVSFPRLMQLLFGITVVVVLLGAIIFFAEQGTYDKRTEKWMRPNKEGNGEEETPFVSIPAGFWWVFTTITTVGYGDLFPTTLYGRLIGICTMLIGVILFALPITVIVGTFFEQLDEEKRQKHETSGVLGELRARERKMNEIVGLMAQLQGLLQMEIQIEKKTIKKAIKRAKSNRHLPTINSSNSVEMVTA